MLCVGLTGASGAGKSTVALGLRDVGIPVLDADRVAHELYVPGSALVIALANTFGNEVLGPSGAIDRAALGRIVFSDPRQLETLNRLVHPPLLAELKRRLDAWEDEGARVGVLEAALLLQWGPPDFVELIVGITAPRPVRLRRLIKTGLSTAAAEKRVDAQVDEQTLTAAADILVDNNGDRQHLDLQIQGLSVELWRRADRAR